jgi:hypothetical protein
MMGTDEIGTDTLHFTIGPNEVIVDASAEVVFKVGVTTQRLSDGTISGNAVEIDYHFYGDRGLCELPKRARVKVTATIGPRLR